MLRPSFDFALKLFYFLTPIFLAQLIIYHFIYSDYSGLIFLSFTFNFIIAIIIYMSTTYFSQKNINSSVVIFLSLTVLKIILFYLVLYPNFILDNKIKDEEVFIFFIPYIICSVHEINELSKFLNSKK
ncbi:MAG: hypothetical protein CMD29_03900 [Flavobacteriales bacterium]|nr:hypothetical protein [Flavobacteriales bacterium]